MDVRPPRSGGLLGGQEVEDEVGATAMAVDHDAAELLTDAAGGLRPRRRPEDDPRVVELTGPLRDSSAELTADSSIAVLGIDRDEEFTGAVHTGERDDLAALDGSHPESAPTVQRSDQ